MGFPRKSRLAFVRGAIAEKLKKERATRLEHQWIQALRKHPDEDMNTYMTDPSFWRMIRKRRLQKPVPLGRVKGRS